VSCKKLGVTGQFKFWGGLDTPYPPFVLPLVFPTTTVLLVEIIATLWLHIWGWWKWALVSPDGVAPSWMVSVSACVNLPLHYKVQKFSSGTSSPGWSWKKGRKTVVVWCGMAAYMHWWVRCGRVCVTRLLTSIPWPFKSMNIKASPVPGGR